MKTSRHKWAEGWTPVQTIGVRKHYVVEIAHNPDNGDFQYCVQYWGNGHYFKTIYEARCYCHGRGWIPDSFCIWEEG